MVERKYSIKHIRPLFFEICDHLGGFGFLYGRAKTIVLHPLNYMEMQKERKFYTLYINRDNKITIKYNDNYYDLLCSYSLNQNEVLLMGNN